MEGSKGKNLKVKGKSLYWLGKYYSKMGEGEKVREVVGEMKGMGLGEELKEVEEGCRSRQGELEGKEREVCGNMFGK